MAGASRESGSNTTYRYGSAFGKRLTSSGLSSLLALVYWHWQSRSRGLRIKLLLGGILFAAVAVGILIVAVLLGSIIASVLVIILIALFVVLFKTVLRPMGQ